MVMKDVPKGNTESLAEEGTICEKYSMMIQRVSENQHGIRVEGTRKAGPEQPVHSLAIFRPTPAPYSLTVSVSRDSLIFTSCVLWLSKRPEREDLPLLFLLSTFLWRLSTNQSTGKSLNLSVSQSINQTLYEGAPRVFRSRRFSKVISRATAYRSKPSTPMLGNRETLGTRSTFRNKVISALGNERLTG